MQRILFAADNHYGMHCGRVLRDRIGEDYAIDFFEDDWSCFDRPLVGRYALIVLNMISGCCNVPPPAATAEANLWEYVSARRPLLLLHGGSAAFWGWDWWRRLAGFRWVRGDDPDGFAPSTHPVRPYRLALSKSRHPLCAHLAEADMPCDEIYINMEQTCPTMTLMHVTTDEGTFPQCYEAFTAGRGRVLGYIPGHHPDVVAHPANVGNCRVLIDDLLKRAG
jgi:pimeloyl-ACP methyl ester carboxylesterase